MLNVVEFSSLRKENMYDDVGVVHSNPFWTPFAIYRDRFGIGFNAGAFFNRVGNSLHLWGGIALTYNKILTNGIVDVRQINNGDSFPFFILYAIHDGVNQ